MCGKNVSYSITYNLRLSFFKSAQQFGLRIYVLPKLKKKHLGDRRPKKFIIFHTLSTIACTLGQKTSIFHTKKNHPSREA